MPIRPAGAAPRRAKSSTWTARRGPAAARQRIRPTGSPRRHGGGGCGQPVGEARADRHRQVRRREAIAGPANTAPAHRMRRHGEPSGPGRRRGIMAARFRPAAAVWPAFRDTSDHRASCSLDQHVHTMTTVATALELSPLVGGKHIATGDTYEVRSPVRRRAGRPRAPRRPRPDRGGDRGPSGRSNDRRLPSWKRAEVLARTADEIEAGRDDFARTIALEAGKPLKASRLEAERAAFTFRVAAEEAKRNYGEIVPLDWLPGTTDRSPTCGASRSGRSPASRRSTSRSTSSRTRSRPRSPQAIRSCCGRQPTPVSSFKLAAMILEAGGPRRHRRRPVQHAGRRSAGGRRAHPPVDLHRQPRRRLGAEKPRGPKRVTLELGGNAAVVVHSDADLDYAADRIAWEAPPTRARPASPCSVSTPHESLGGFDQALARGDALVVGDPLTRRPTSAL